MLEIARFDGEEFVRIAELAKRTKVPKPYLAKIIKQLVQSGLLLGRKGPGGGVKLSPRGKRSSFYDVCLAVNEPVIEQKCFLSRHPCNCNNYCPYHDKWKNITSVMSTFLKSSKIRTC